MVVVLAWFAQEALPADVDRGLRDRFDLAVSALVPEDYQWYDAGCGDWGTTVLHPPTQGVLRWSPVAEGDGVTGLSLGIPVGVDTAPVQLARRLLAGEDALSDVVPPFGLIALDGSRRVAVQQDWLGMSRLFTASFAGVTAFSNRPSLLAEVLGMPLSPAPDGWVSYAVCGHFGGDSSPIRGVHLMRPGQRVSGIRREAGGWDLKTSFGRTVDDLVLTGAALRKGGMTQALDLAADGITSALVSAADLAEGEIVLGLSGGKDSRLIAASFIAAGRLPRFNTNVDTPAEGETAARLLKIVRETRDLEPVHRLYNAGAPAAVLQTGLLDRVRRLQRQHDLQSSSTYAVRVPAPERLPATTRAMSFTGAGGELATGYWYPPAGSDQDDDAARGAATVHLLGPDAPVQDHVLEAERDRVSAILDHAASLGLRGVELCDYLYLVERVRRWYTSGYVLGIVTPFLSPGFVTASFALTPAAKRRRVLHVGLLARYVPEWLEVPYVSVSTGRSTAARVWEGDGLQALCDVVDTHHGDLPRLLRRDDVERALQDASAGRATKRQEKTLQQLAWLAVASETLEPASVLVVEPTTYARVLAARPEPYPQRTAPAVPLAVTAIASRVRFVKRTRLGRKAWAAARSRLLTAA